MIKETVHLVKCSEESTVVSAVLSWFMGGFIFRGVSDLLPPWSLFSLNRFSPCGGRLLWTLCLCVPQLVSPYIYTSRIMMHQDCSFVA
jgi:hypothetical protein